MRKGFVYTLFTLIVLNLVVITALMPLEAEAGDETSFKTNIDELYYFLKSVQGDIGRGGNIAGRRALVAVTTNVLSSGRGAVSAEDSIKEAFLNGTVGGNSSSVMRDTTFRDWIDKMEAQAVSEGYSFNMSAGNSTVRSNGFNTFFDVFYNLSVNDPSADAGFEKLNQNKTVPISVEGLDDPLMMLNTDAKYSLIVERCEKVGAERIMEGSSYEYNYTSKGSEREWVSGLAEKYDGSDVSTVDNRDEKVLFTSDLCRYDAGLLDEFRGVVSEIETDGADICGSGEEIEAYIGGVDNYSMVEEGVVTVMDINSVWENYLPTMVDTGCYFHDVNGPDFLSRLENSLDGSNGIGTLLNVPELPAEFQAANLTAVGHNYFEGEESDNRVKGVSDRENYLWFRLDQNHLEMWEMEQLEY